MTGQASLWPTRCACGHDEAEHDHTGLCAWCACAGRRAPAGWPPPGGPKGWPIVPTPHATSAAAERSIIRAAPNLRRRVFDAIEAAGAAGLIAEEVEGATGLGGNTVRPRLMELAKEGRIMRAPRVRPTRSGRCAVVWVVAPGGGP